MRHVTRLALALLLVLVAAGPTAAATAPVEPPPRTVPAVSDGTGALCPEGYLLRYTGGTPLCEEASPVNAPPPPVDNTQGKAILLGSSLLFAVLLLVRFLLVRLFRRRSRHAT